MTSGDPGGTNSIFSAILVEEMQCLPVERRPIFCSKLRERKREKERERERERVAFLKTYFLFLNFVYSSSSTCPIRRTSGGAVGAASRDVISGCTPSEYPRCVPAAGPAATLAALGPSLCVLQQNGRNKEGEEDKMTS